MTGFANEAPGVLSRRFAGGGADCSPRLPDWGGAVWQGGAALFSEHAAGGSGVTPRATAGGTVAAVVGSPSSLLDGRGAACRAPSVREVA